ncbi:MAG: hypothetical protein JNL28_01710 [Planctomycetes bacterium]|nr:hypothetical protein [Planctomycetota bacterium]
MLLPQSLIFAALDLGEIIQWIANHIGPIFVAVFFFIVPILKAIKESAEKKRKQAGQASVPQAEEREAESDGRRMWEELLRGETTASVLPPPVPPAPPATASFEGAEQAADAPSLAGRLSDFADAGDENALESESAVDQERRAVEINDEMLRVEMLRRSDFLARERESAARKTVAPDGISTFTETAPGLAAVSRGASARQSLFVPGESRRSALRRAIIAREILGQPLALRSRNDALGPTALSD